MPRLYPNAALVNRTLGGNCSVIQAKSGPVNSESNTPRAHCAKKASTGLPQDMIHRNIGAKIATDTAPTLMTRLRPIRSDKYPAAMVVTLKPQMEARRLIQNALDMGLLMRVVIYTAIQTKVR
mmetsp:Transcript_23629/g.40337  ORF Transcript_23629/g.40337 Transcript_23629/m.40337 type:complete len:123 (+) Transcript_23629:948-1316(+)